MEATILERESKRIREKEEDQIKGDFDGKWRIMDGICEICEKLNDL